MGRESGAARRKIDHAWVGLGMGNELRNGLGGKRWIYQHYKRNAEEARDRRDVADEIEIELVVERRVDRVRGADQEQRVAIRGLVRDRLGADVGTRGPVLDSELLAETLREPLTDHACGDVARAAGGKRYDPAHRPRRIGLRPRDPRHRRQRGDAGGQMEKISAGSFIPNLPYIIRSPRRRANADIPDPAPTCRRSRYRLRASSRLRSSPTPRDICR